MSSHEPALVAKLDALEQRLPALIEEYPDEGDFWNAFAGEADVILESGLNASDDQYAKGRVDCMLKNAGLIPGEEEGAPCK